MNANFGYANAISTALAASAAFAQTGDTAPSTTNQPIHAWPQTAPRLSHCSPVARVGWQTGGGLALKLIGVAVYSADNRKVGTVKDVLIDHDGVVQVILIGVGGFLGVGAKDVACLSPRLSGGPRVASCRRISRPSTR